MKILVTGASGRVGSNLALALLRREHAVRAFVYPGDASRMHKLDDAGVETVYGELGNVADVARAVQGVDAIYHLAAAMIGPFENADYFEINARGTFNVLEAARLHAPNLRRLIYASTDAVYPGFPDTEPGGVATEDGLVKPLGLYAFSKWTGERMALMYHEAYGLPAVACRFAWVIGAGELLDPGYVKTIWLSQLLAQYRAADQSDPATAEATRILESLWTGEEKLTYTRSKAGMPQKQHYVDVRDLVQGLLLALERPEAVGEVYNLPGPAMLSFDEVIPYAAQQLGLPWVEARLPVSLGYNDLSWAKAHRLLGYTPIHDYRSMVAAALAIRRGEPIDIVPTGVPYGPAPAR